MKAEVKNFVLACGLDDWFDLCGVADFLAQQYQSASRDERIVAGVAAIKELHEGGSIDIGEVPPSGKGFAPWCLPSDEIAIRVESEWKELPGEPNVGDICWIANTKSA